MTRFLVDFTQTVEVELDETKFDEAFMAEFRESFYHFTILTDHAEHIAQLQARGIIDVDHFTSFIEGYGPSDEMGIKARIVGTDIQSELAK